MKIAEAMALKLSTKDKRALKILGIFVVVLLAFLSATKWLGHWGQVRKSLAAARAELELISPSKAKQEGLASVVPVFEMPQVEEKQKFLFREKFNEQLKKAGINSEPMQILATVKLPGEADYKLLRLKCHGKCGLGQIFDLLTGLKENPYLAGIEEFKIECNPKNRQEIELDLMVSTFVRSEG